MSNKLTAVEKETIIIFNEEDMTANVSTYNRILIRKLSALCKTHPDEVTGSIPDKYGEANYIIPKKWIKITAGPILSDEQINRKREAGKALHN